LGKRIIISGATGLIGKKLIAVLSEKGYSITVLSRNKNSAKRILGDKADIMEWDYTKPSDDIVEVINGSFSIINLSGASIAGKRWNEEYKKVIYDSRVLTAKKITEAISKCNSKPDSFISSSASGYYGLDGEESMTEDSPSGNDYLAKVCKDWESSAMEAEKYGVRAVCVRIAVVLDKNEGALLKLIKPFKFFIGGHLGNGKQWFPWIHIDDLVNLFIFSLENPGIKGGLNGAAPEQTRNKDFCKSLGKVMGRPGLFPVPEFALKIAVGEFATYLLTGRKIFPEKALRNGFKFKYDNLESALTNILK
jgi:uncharacterized protein (TIGR01777 family)